MKIALVHDYLIEAGGAERVLSQLAKMYPEAPIYTALYKRGTAWEIFKDKQIIESKWAPILKVGRLYSYLRFLLPLVWRSMDLSEYDVVITSSSGYIARGFRVGSQTRVICYCHTPPRWLYGYDTPTGAQYKWWGRIFMWIAGPFVRYFDYMSAQEVDLWIANSREVAARIFKFYRKKAIVINPPIEIASREITREPGDYFLMVSRIVGGKGLYEIAAIFAELKMDLVVVGEEVEHKLAVRLKKLAPHVKLLGRVTDERLVDLYSHARAFVAASRDEDFGMSVVEAQAYGVPVLAYRGGGYLETVIEGENGVFFDRFDKKEIKQKTDEIAETSWRTDRIVKSAKKYAPDEFERKVRKVIGD